MKVISLTIASFVAASVALAQTTIADWQFNDSVTASVGAYLGGNQANQVDQGGSDTGGSWNFGGVRQQNGTGNFGYTQNYKYTSVDSGTAATQAYRQFTLGTSLTSSSHTTYSLEMHLPKWDLRKTWDPNAGSTTGKGIYLSVRASNNDEAFVGFETQGTGGVRAFSNVSGTNGVTGSFASINGGAFKGTQTSSTLKTPVRFGNSSANNPGISLKIEGDLTTGAWTTYAKDTNHDEWVQVNTGGNLTTIAGLRYASKSPSQGSWGGAGNGATIDPTLGGTAGDYMEIDYMTLSATAVPEPQTLALIAGFLAFGYVMVRRRK